MSPEEVAAVDGTMGTAQEQPAGQPLTRHGGVFVCECVCASATHMLQKGRQKHQ